MSILVIIYNKQAQKLVSQNTAFTCIGGACCENVCEVMTPSVGEGGLKRLFFMLWSVSEDLYKEKKL